VVVAEGQPDSDVTVGLADELAEALVDGPPRRTATVASVPHITSGRLVEIVPSWLRGPRDGPCRVGASSAFSRISRNVRRRVVCTPRRRSRAWTLRWPSPRMPCTFSASASTSRTWPSKASSDSAVRGPGLLRGVAVARAFRQS
jgi:hypothetical protein